MCVGLGYTDLFTNSVIYTILYLSFLITFSFLKTLIVWTCGCYSEDSGLLRCDSEFLGKWFLTS